MPLRVLRLVRFELAKLFRQKLPWVVLIPIFGAVALVMLRGIDVGEAAEDPLLRNGFEYMTTSCLWALRLVSVFAVVVASLALSSEASQGTWRMVLVRPVTRTDVFVAKALVVAILVLALFALTVAVSYGLLHLVHGFWRDGSYMSPLTDGKFRLMGEELVSDRERTLPILAGDLRLALALSLLPLLASGFFGLLISALFDNTGAAVGLGLFFAVFLFGFASVDRKAGRWVFSHAMEYGMTVAQHRARGLTDKKWEQDEIDRAWAVPLVSGVAFLGAAWVVFRRKDILT
jgi:ABC-2 type transport system permease protein